MSTTGKYNYDFSGKVVLVVEDNPISFKLMSAVLSQVKATIVHAGNGRIAIDLCKGDQHFDLVIMDMQMPEVNGLVATREIKKMRPDLPIVAATANTFEEEESSFREAGCDGFLTKPLQFRKLFAMMDSLLDK